MNETALVFAAEFARRLRSRPFIIATIVGAIGIALVVEAPALFAPTFTAQRDAIVLAGPPSLRAPAAELMRPNFHVKASVDEVPQPLTMRYLDDHGKATAAVVLSAPQGQVHVDVYARDVSAWTEEDFGVLSALGVHIATGQPLAQARRAVTVRKTLHSLDAKFADSGAAALGHGIAIGLVTILYLSILISAQAVVSSVAEEKTSRIAEVLVATISPISLLTGKTLAAASLALLQIAVWVATAAAFVPRVFASLGASAHSSTPALASLPQDMVAFVGFFVLGFLEFSTIYAAAASLISRTEDLGSVSGPVVMPAVAGFLVAQFALIAPDAPFVIAMSFVPFLSPFVMFTRIALETVPAWQIATSLAINAVTAAACFYAAGKVYRVGMLLYGKLPSLRQVVAVLRS